MQTQLAVRVGFELATDGIQFYVFANLDKTSLPYMCGREPARRQRGDPGGRTPGRGPEGTGFVRLIPNRRGYSCLECSTLRSVSLVWG